MRPPVHHQQICSRRCGQRIGHHVAGALPCGNDGNIMSPGQLARPLFQPRVRIGELGIGRVGAVVDAQARMVIGCNHGSAVQRLLGGGRKIGDGNNGLKVHGTSR